MILTVKYEGAAVDPRDLQGPVRLQSLPLLVRIKTPRTQAGPQPWPAGTELEVECTVEEGS